jgi:hypothetical protein
MTIRTVGADEIAEDSNLGTYTLDIFRSMEHRNSTVKVFVPWLPTLGHTLRMWDAFRLYLVFSRIVREHKRTGTVRRGTMQFLIDSGADVKDITAVSDCLLFIVAIENRYIIYISKGV